MSDPTVACVMLVNGREPMVRRAVQSFRGQTYSARLLLLLDTSAECRTHELQSLGRPSLRMVVLRYSPEEVHRSIGQLRNIANGEAARYWGPDTIDIICHWDSDDYSHPNRIAEQVALLESSGAEGVGYNEMIFWREPQQLSNADVYGKQECEGYIDPDAPCDVFEGEAWLYSNPNPRWALGTSLCYWRKTWEARPFPDLPHGEDTEWLAEVNCAAVNSNPYAETTPYSWSPGLLISDDQPRMIASIHSGNTSPVYRPEVMRANEMQGDVWKRVPAWDAHCADRMKL